MQYLKQELCQYIRYYLRNVAILGNKYMIFASLLEPTAVDIILINKGNEDISEWLFARFIQIAFCKPSIVHSLSYTGADNCLMAGKFTQVIFTTPHFPFFS